ncbi:MAG: hypothetical protein KGZ74_00620 [Chitinophagaceae bacterium]|nr:hypothetical protein [Chitinophagaceae bacterium]
MDKKTSINYLDEAMMFHRDKQDHRHWVDQFHEQILKTVFEALKQAYEIKVGEKWQDDFVQRITRFSLAGDITQRQTYVIDAGTPDQKQLVVTYWEWTSDRNRYDLQIEIVEDIQKAPTH